ncbi:MAG: AraC family transcriptional regulator [Chryseolinea sp.]
MRRHQNIQTKGELENTLSEFFASGTNQLVIEGSLGKFDNQRVVCPDFTLNRQQFQNGRQMLAIPIHRDRPCITMIFQFGGLSAYRDKYNPFLLPNNHHSINFFNRFDCKTLVDEMGVQHEINITLEESFYHNILGTIADDGNEMSEKALRGIEFNTINDRMPMDAGIYGVVQNILNCPFEGSLRDTYTKTQVTALMHLQFWQLNRRLTSKDTLTDTKINARDVAILYAIRDFIDKSFLDHSTVLTLSRRFGINEFKLKYGFKKIFNTSPIKYLLDKRMSHAAMILKSTQDAVNDVARTMGYSLPNNFTAAFKKHFGMTPQQYRSRN